MNTYIGNLYGFKLTEDVVNSTTSIIAVTYSNTIPGGNVYQIQYRVIGGGSWTSSPPIYMNNPGTINVPTGTNEYRVQLFFSNGNPFQYITFIAQIVDQNNYIYIPKACPLVFFKVGQTQPAKFLTKHFEQYGFEDRGYFWQDRETYRQPWMTTDTISFQLESSMNPLVFQICNCYNDVIIQVSATASMQHILYTNLFAYDFNCSLAGLSSGLYKGRIVAGFGTNQIILETKMMYISSTEIIGTVWHEYFHSNKCHRDTMYGSGIKYGIRLHAEFGLLDVQRADEMWRDQDYNTGMLTSKQADQRPFIYGKPGGLPEDQIKIIHEIWSCDTVILDNKYFGLATSSKVDYTPIKRSRLRFMTIQVEDGLNRNSRIFQTILDPQKRLFATGVVDGKIWGAQSGANTINVTNIE